MDEDYMLWQFLEEERERYAAKDAGESGENGNSSRYEEDEEEDEDEMDDEYIDTMSKKIGQGILRRGGNY